MPNHGEYPDEFRVRAVRVVLAHDLPWPPPAVGHRPEAEHEGPYQPSSQTCSGCGAGTKLALWQRIYDCDHCGLHVDRDVNAARDIRAEGERLWRDQQRNDEHGVASIRAVDVQWRLSPSHHT